MYIHSIYMLYTCIYMLYTCYTCIYYIPPPLTVHFSMTRSVRYQPILHTLYYTLHTEHAYCLSYRFFGMAAQPELGIVLEEQEVKAFVDRNKAVNTVRKTRSDISIWCKWCNIRLIKIPENIYYNPVCHLACKIYILS